MIEKIGFFHFVDGYEDPIGQLNTAFNEWNVEPGSEHPANSLVVLPEAFNLGRKYGNRSDCDRARLPTTL